MNGFARVLLGVLCLAALSSPTWAQDAELNTLYHDNTVLGSHTIPLPPGDWTAVAVGSAADTSRSRVYLAQLESGRLVRWIYISTNTEYKSDGWKRNTEICDRKNVQAGYSDSLYNPKDAECWMLNHWGETLGNHPSQIAIDFYRWSDGRGRPNTSLGLAYFFAKRGDFLTVVYHFNPVLAGFRDTPTASWRGNPWHVDVASKDARKLAYLRQLKALGEQHFAELRTVLH